MNKVILKLSYNLINESDFFRRRRGRGRGRGRVVLTFTHLPLNSIFSRGRFFPTIL
jgi:hypothetical protein